MELKNYNELIERRDWLIELIDEKNECNDGTKEFNDYIDSLWDEVDEIEKKIYG